MNLQQTAQEIYTLMQNFEITKVHNCMTRLLLVKLTYTENLPLTKLKNINNVLGVNLNGNELQIILGPGKVNEVTAQFKLLLNKNKQKSKNQASNFGQAENFIKKFVKKMLHHLN